MSKSYGDSHNRKADIKVGNVVERKRDNKQKFKLHNKSLSLQEFENESDEGDE